MTETQKQALLVSLTKTIEEWTEGDDVQENYPHYWGDEIGRTMATAAIAVLEGAANQEICVLREHGIQD